MAVLNLDGHPDRAFFGIFDGHGGAQVAKFCAKHMPELFLNSEEYKRGDVEAALVSAYLGIDEKLRDPANAEELNRMKAKSSANSNGTGLEAVDQQESVGSGMCQHVEHAYHRADCIVSPTAMSRLATNCVSATLTGYLISLSEVYFLVLCRNGSSHSWQPQYVSCRHIPLVAILLLCPEWEELVCPLVPNIARSILLSLF